MGGGSDGGCDNSRGKRGKSCGRNGGDSRVLILTIVGLMIIDYVPRKKAAFGCFAQKGNG